MINLGKLKEIKDLRKVWPHEALDFTPWLAEEDSRSHVITVIAEGIFIATRDDAYGLL